MMNINTTTVLSFPGGQFPGHNANIITEVEMEKIRRLWYEIELNFTCKYVL